MRFEEIKYQRSRTLYTMLLGTVAVGLSVLLVLAQQPFMAIPIVVVLAVFLIKVRAPLLVSINEEGIKYGWQWFGQRIQHLPWSKVQSYTFQEVSVLKKDGRTINRLTQLPQTALALKTKSGQMIYLGIEDVVALEAVLKIAAR